MLRGVHAALSRFAEAWAICVGESVAADRERDERAHSRGQAGLYGRAVRGGARAIGRLFYGRGARLERRDQKCREDSRRAQRHSRSAAGYGTDRVTLKKGNKIMSTNTIKLHRVLRATPERVYKAFLDADAMAKWLPPYGFTGKV